MMVSWVLECIKCVKMRDLLFELKQEEAAECLDATFPLYIIRDENSKNATLLLEWINKHKNHGGIIFKGYA